MLSKIAPKKTIEPKAAFDALPTLISLLANGSRSSVLIMFDKLISSPCNNNTSPIEN